MTIDPDENIRFNSIQPVAGIRGECGAKV